MTEGNVVDLELKGGTAYEAALCTDEFEIGVGEMVALLQLRTIDDATLTVPIPLGAIDDLAALLVEASKAADKRLRPGKVQIRSQRSAVQMEPEYGSMNLSRR